MARSAYPQLCLGVVALLTLLPLPAFGYRNYDYNGTTMNQKDTGGYASNNFWNGSGDSKTEGVNNAMRALNCLAALDIGGAFSYGYKGYGQYINSQRMDDLNTAAWNVKAAMASVGDQANITGSANGSGNAGSDSSSVTGSANGSNAQPGSTSSTGASAGDASSISSGSGGSAASGGSHMLANMDTGFLYRGETNDVASEFEQKSGMSRDTFFNELAATEASGLSWNDPNLMDKLESRYQSFVSKIPNQDYKANIEKMHDMFNAAKKLDVLEKVADFYKENRWGNGGDKAAQDADAARAAALAATKAAGNDASRAPASEAASTIAVQAKTDDKPKLTKEQMGMYLGLEGSHGDELKDFMGPEDSIFRLVSKRYRKLTPMMLSKAI